MPEEILADFTLTSFKGPIDMEQTKYGSQASLNVDGYKLKTPIKGYVQKRKKSIQVVWEPNPSGKTKLEQGSPIIGMGKTIQEAFTDFINTLTDAYDMYSRTPPEKLDDSAKDYVEILKNTISKTVPEEKIVPTRANVYDITDAKKIEMKFFVPLGENENKEP